MKKETDYKPKKSTAARVFIGLSLFIAAGILLIAVNFIPAATLETKGMHRKEGNWITAYYEEEEEAALDVFRLADRVTDELAGQLGFTGKENVNVYIYDSQKTMQMRKYGLIGPLLGLDWYIGDNIGTDVILTSPANPGPAHNYDDNKYAVLHEIVHAYISTVNPGIHLWLTEGTALYLTNGEPYYKKYAEQIGIPSYADTKTRNPIRFSNCGGYIFAGTYIEYLADAYGWEPVNELIRTEDYEAVFGCSQQDIYEEWVSYIKNYKQ